MHRRPLGRGRTLGALSALAILVGCVLPWYTAAGGDSGITPIAYNAFTDKGIVVFVCALAVLALVSLPYAAGDKPVAMDRALSYVILAVIAFGAYLWRVVEFALIDPIGLRPDLGPGVWLVGAGLIGLGRAAYEISRERRF